MSSAADNGRQPCRHPIVYCPAFKELMKYPTSNLSNNISKIATCRRLICVLAGALALASCGGGGGSATPPQDATPPTVLDGFLGLMPALGFSWSTSQQTSVGIELSRASGAALGDLTVSVSNYFCTDPTGGGGTLAHPVRTSALTSYTLDAGQQKVNATTFDLAALALQVPTAANYVLVEVYDGASNTMLYGKLVAPAALPTLKISVPAAAVRASCAGPG